MLREKVSDSKTNSSEHGITIVLHTLYSAAAPLSSHNHQPDNVTVISTEALHKELFTKISFVAAQGIVEILPKHQSSLWSLSAGVLVATTRQGQDIRLELSSPGVLSCCNDLVEITAPEISLYQAAKPHSALL